MKPKCLHMYRKVDLFILQINYNIIDIIIIMRKSQHENKAPDNIFEE